MRQCARDCEYTAFAGPDVVVNELDGDDVDAIVQVTNLSTVDLFPTGAAAWQTDDRH